MTLKIRTNCSISGEPARILTELKKRGLVTSNTNAVINGLLVLHEKLLEKDLKEARLGELQKSRRMRDLEE